MHVWLGRGRARVLDPVLFSLRFPTCQPAPSATIMSQMSAFSFGLSFSQGPFVSPSSPLNSLWRYCPPLPPPVILKPSKLKAPIPHMQVGDWAGQSGRVQSVSPVALGYIQTRSLSWDIQSLDSMPRTLHRRCAHGLWNLRRCWCGSLHFQGEKGETTEGSCHVRIWLYPRAFVVSPNPPHPRLCFFTHLNASHNFSLAYLRRNPTAVSLAWFIPEVLLN